MLKIHNQDRLTCSFLGEKVMNLTTVILFVIAWFLVSVIHGIIDNATDKAPFWKRPVILVAVWFIAAISALLAYWMTSTFGPTGLFLSVPVMVLGIIGPIGCSFFIPWIDVFELP